MAAVRQWLPETSFTETNASALEAIFSVTRKLFPNSGAEILKLDEGALAPEAMGWMLQKFLGHQHGTMEGSGDKLVLDDRANAAYRPAVEQLHLGPHSFMHGTPTDPSAEYDKAFVLGGTPQEMSVRLLAAVAGNPHEASVDTIMTMTGQRLRWNVIGERSNDEILATVGRHTGTDIDHLLAASPWLKQELARPGTEWLQALGTEYALGRLVTEAVFYDMIDWSNYPVELVEDTAANPLSYEHQGQVKTVPPRTEVLARYNLKDGRMAQVFNAKALPRQGALPRPNSDSQTQEAVEYLTFESGEAIIAASSAPHVRAAMDAVVRILKLRGAMIAKADLANGSWVEGMEILAALGEIPATIQSEQRLRALL